jgi:hypothetical protein
MILKKLTYFQIHRWTAGKKSFKCMVCGKMHGTHNALYLHMLWKHPEKNITKCRLCNKYVEAPNGLEAHFDECHSGEISTSLKTKILKCQFCEKIFLGRKRKILRSEHTRRYHSDTAVRCAALKCCRFENKK